MCFFATKVKPVYYTIQVGLKMRSNSSRRISRKRRLDPFFGRSCHLSHPYILAISLHVNNHGEFCIGINLRLKKTNKVPRVTCKFFDHKVHYLQALKIKIVKHVIAVKKSFFHIDLSITVKLLYGVFHKALTLKY